MNYKTLKKPEHLAEETWEQHLHWMDVMGKQVDKNFSRHLARAREDARRAEALWDQHLQVIAGARRNRSLFSR